jgi:hypothetical protein
MATTKKKGVHYIDNKEFHAAMIAWKELCKEAEEAGEEKPQVTNYIGECFLKIANGLSYRPNFINYTYRSEMVSDGIENCLQYIHNFDPEKSKNPFAYFTQIIYYAFIRRIQKEKKQTTIKNRLIMEGNYDDMTLNDGEDRQFRNQFSEFLQRNADPKDVPVVKKKTTRKRKGKLDKFIE